MSQWIFRDNSWIKYDENAILEILTNLCRPYHDIRSWASSGIWRKAIKKYNYEEIYENLNLCGFVVRIILSDVKNADYKLFKSFLEI